MCEGCGCGQSEEHEVHAGHEHDHVHPHDHAHDHDHPHTHPHDHADHGHGRIVRLEEKLLAQNDAVAAENRRWLAARRITALNLISAPGTGKTLLLERTLERLRNRVGCAVIAGDQRTDNDARRLEGKGAPVVQIETNSACHLDAARVREVLPTVVESTTRLLFIENVGNLVCPAAFDLGESFKVALLSTTEGEDKPLKYPSLFIQAPIVVLTKTDLIPHLDWDAKKCRDALRRIHPGIFLFELSARTGDGMDAWVDYLARLAE